MEAPNSPGRRTLLKAGALSLATPVIGAAAQPAASHKEAGTFDLWVISDSHVGTDKAVSDGIRHGLAGFHPPPVSPNRWPRRSAHRRRAAHSAARPLNGTSR